MLIVFFTVHFACSHYIEQAAVDSLATCWRELQHEHGEHVKITYTCNPLRAAHSHCRLHVATCPEIAVDASSKSLEAQTHTGSDEFLEFTLELEHIDDRFRLLIKDHFKQGVVVSGKIGTGVRSRKRQLSTMKSLNGYATTVGPQWTGLADTSLFGTRRDCKQEECPRRWTDCWPGAADSMKQIQVFLAMDSSFCDSFKNTAACEEYTLGLFRDMNLVYEEQMGISLRPSVLLPPDAIERFWPSIALAKSSENVDGGEFLNAFTKLSCDEEDNKGYFRRVIGRPASFFGIFHIIVGEKLKFSSRGKISANILGRGGVNTLCTCTATGWTRYVGDKPSSETWGTLAHEIAHNFGGRHFFDHRKTNPGEDPNSGILGYGDGVVGGVYAFSDVNKHELCSSVSKILRIEENSENQCFSPYYGVRQEDSRSQESYYLVASAFGIILSILGIITCLVVQSTTRQVKLRRKYNRLRTIHKADVKELEFVAEEQQNIIVDTEEDLLMTENMLHEATLDKAGLEKDVIVAEAVAIEKAEEVEILQECLQADVEAKKMHQPKSLTPAQSPSSRSVMTGSVSQQRTPHFRQMAAADVEATKMQQPTSSPPTSSASSRKGPSVIAGSVSQRRKPRSRQTASVDRAKFTPQSRERSRASSRPRDVQAGYAIRKVCTKPPANPYCLSPPTPPFSPKAFSKRAA